MPKPEDGQRRNFRFRGEKPLRRRKGTKSIEFRTFAETLVVFGDLIKKSHGAGLDETKKLLHDDPKTDQDQ